MDASTQRKCEDAIQAAADRLRQRHADAGDPHPEPPRTAADCTAWGERTGYTATIERFASRMRRAFKRG